METADSPSLSAHFVRVRAARNDNKKKPDDTRTQRGVAMITRDRLYGLCWPSHPPVQHCRFL